MKIGIVGYGFVGKAIEAGIRDNVKLIKIDPKLNTSIKELDKFCPDIIFVCVPTPMNDDNSQDISILNDVSEELAQLDSNPLFVIKSTVLPNYIKNIEIKLKRIVYNPEFLREKHANNDFINSKFIIFGGKKKFCSELELFYRKNTNCISEEYIYTDLISASLMKYAINSFLATKVIFFNEMNKLFKLSGAEDSWEKFIESIANDTRIGNSHMNVPGHDGRLGFGGACFPKDISALENYADSLGISLNILKSVISTNNNIRGKYNNATNREADQNINFLKGDS